MIIWSGRGFLSVIVLIGILFPAIYLFPEDASDYAFVTALFLTAVFSWYLGILWNTKNERIVIDEASGQKLKIKNNHTLFWIPMQYWGIIFSIGGIIILLQNSVTIALLSAIAFLGIVLFEKFKKKSFNNTALPRFKSPGTKRKEIAAAEELKIKEAEALAERIKRRKEKEDPRRFMPQ